MKLILIGPRGIGKTTVAKLIQDKTGFNYVSLDDAEKKLESSMRQTLIGRLTTVKNVFRDYCDSPCIYDFGCYHSFIMKAELFDQIQALLESESNVFLLLPSINIYESMEALLTTNRHQITNIQQLDMVMKTNLNMLKCSKHNELAKHVIYTKDKTPNEIADEIIVSVK